MRFAVLGTDPNILALAIEARALGHQIVWLGDVRAGDAAAVAQISPAIQPATNWEVLLDHATADAVLVGRGAASDDLRAEQLKRFATDAVPVLAIHPIVDSILTYYELDMLRRETGGILQHYNPVVIQPLMDQLSAWCRDGHEQIGTIHQVTCEHHIADASRNTVLRHLARDAELLAAVSGGIRQVSAVGPQSTDASYASLQAQMASALVASLRWSVLPPRSAAGGIEVILIGERGTVAARMVNDATGNALASWQLETNAGDEQQTERLEHNSAKAAIERLSAALAVRSPEGRTTLATWDKATQSMEVVDAVELSLQKGRTIEVHQQQLTERLAFRGTMAAIGCGLLTFGFVVVVIAAMLGGLETLIEQPLMRPWPVVVLAVLAFFLLLQTVPLLAAKRSSSNPNKDGPG